MTSAQTPLSPDSPSFPQFFRAADQVSLVEAARTRFVDAVVAIQSGDSAAVTDDGLVRVVLTGGGAGTELLSALADDSGGIDWQKVLVFFGDERFVAADSDDRNALAARERLLDAAGVPEEHIFEFAAADSGVTPAEAAEAYGQILADKAPDGFDVHLLGMGPEGHINSIFPHSPALAERAALVVDVYDSPKPPPIRITLTMPAINSSNRVWLLVAGGEKAKAVAEIAAQDDLQQWPAAGVRGADETIVFVDEAAAAML